MDPVRFAVSRPYTVAVGVILALLFSFLALQSIPVQLKPDVDAPLITVMTIYPGAGPVEVEEQITRKIEDLLQSVDGLRKLTSSSQEGLSNIVLEYEWGENKDRALIDVNNKLRQLEPLPLDAEQPIVSLTGQMGEDVSMWIVARSPYPPDRIRNEIHEIVEPQIKRVPGVANLMVIGGEEREIQVEVDPDRAAALGVTAADMAAVLRSGYLDRRGGTLETGTRQFVVRTEGRRPELDEIERLVVRRGPNGTVRLGDIAQVVDTYKERSSIVHSGGQDIVCIGVQRQSGANVIDMIEGVDETLVSLNSRMKQQGLAIELVPVYRDTTYLTSAMGFVQENLLLGAGLAVLVLLVFLRSLRSVIVVAAAIPISLLTVFLVLQAFGRTLNIISLAGLAFAAGMVVDNAIVVLENIFRRFQAGDSAEEAAVRGGQEVWGGVLASTLTTIAVFVPILSIQEEAGQLFADLAIAIAAAVGLSLVAALTVVPSFTAVLFKGGRKAKKPKREGPITRAYGALAGGLTARGAGPVLVKLSLVLLVLAGAIGIYQMVPPAGYLPSGNANLILFIGQPIPGTRPEAVAQNMSGLENWITAQPETSMYFVVVAPMFTGGGVVLKDEYATGEGLDGFKDRMMPLCFGSPGFRFFVPIRMGLFQDTGSQFTLEITGADLGVLSEVATRLQSQLNTWPGVQAFGVQSNYDAGQPELKVFVDQHLASEAGFSVQEIGAVVETALAGRKVGTYSDGGRDYDLKVVMPQDRVQSPDALRRLPLATPRGSLTTLGALADIEVSSGPRMVNRLERERAITLTVTLDADAVLQSVLEDVQTNLIEPALTSLPPGYRIEKGGSADKFSRTLDALTGSFWLAVLISYLLLVALFRSWLSPFVILVTVPLALSGGLLGIVLATKVSADASFDLLSMLGFVILAGIVVNNAILIIHQSNNLRDEGRERRSALTEAAKTRLRPIVMSVTTSVFGMLPLAVGSGAGSELYQGLAAVVVGGLVVSTFFTLFLVPALVSLGWDVADVFKRRPAAA